jgi:hypothetical protein
MLLASFALESRDTYQHQDISAEVNIKTVLVFGLFLCSRNDLSDTAVRAVVPALTSLTALTSLELQGLHLTAPPPGILQMKGLKYLGLGLGYYNQVRGSEPCLSARVNAYWIICCLLYMPTARLEFSSTVQHHEVSICYKEVVSVQSTVYAIAFIRVQNLYIVPISRMPPCNCHLYLSLFLTYPWTCLCTCTCVTLPSRSCAPALSPSYCTASGTRHVTGCTASPPGPGTTPIRTISSRTISLSHRGENTSRKSSSCCCCCC